MNPIIVYLLPGNVEKEITDLKEFLGGRRHGYMYLDPEPDRRAAIFGCRRPVFELLQWEPRYVGISQSKTGRRCVEKKSQSQPVVRNWWKHLEKIGLVFKVRVLLFDTFSAAQSWVKI